MKLTATAIPRAIKQLLATGKLSLINVPETILITNDYYCLASNLLINLTQSLKELFPLISVTSLCLEQQFA